MNMYQDAVIDETADSNVICVYEGLGYEQLKAQMIRHPGLLDNLSIWSVLGSKSSNFLKTIKSIKFYIPVSQFGTFFNAE